MICFLNAYLTGRRKMIGIVYESIFGIINMVFSFVFLFKSYMIISEYEWLQEEDTQERLASLYEDDNELENLGKFYGIVGFMFFFGFYPLIIAVIVWLIFGCFAAFVCLS